MSNDTKNPVNYEALSLSGFRTDILRELLLAELSKLRSYTGSWAVAKGVTICAMLREIGTSEADITSQLGR